MRGDETLGFYSFDGTAYLSLEIAEDPGRLAATVNHEMTHQILAHTTGSGVMLEILRAGVGHQFLPSGPRAAATELYDQVWAASRTVHEATATYAGLADHTGPALTAAVDRLPDFHRRAYAVFAGLFAGRDWPALERYRVARAIGARALQTTVYDRWLTGALWRPDRLREHLDDPRNHPGARLNAIVAALRSVPDADLRAWAGRHVRGATAFELRPLVPPPLAGLDFAPLPPVDDLRRGIEERAAVLKLPPPGPVERSGRLDIALAPPAFAAVDADPGDPHWATDADLALVVPNAFDTPYVFTSPRGGQEIPPRGARAFLFRPDHPAARRHTVALAGLADLLDRVDPARRLPLCVAGNSAWLAVAPEDGPAAGIREWATGRPVLLYTGGTLFGLIAAAGLLDRPGERLMMHRMLGGPTWGLILLRSPGNPAVTAVHPILLAEWDRLGETVYEQTGAEPETDPADFFPGGAGDAAPVVAFLRVYRGMTMPLGRWTGLAAAMAAGEARAPHRPVPSAIRRTEYDDAR